MHWVDVVSIINMVLILGSFFLALGIITSLRGPRTYTLAKGWPYILVAVLIFAVLQTYNFFTEYTVYTYSRCVQELILLSFSISVFVGLLVQYLAIQEVIIHRAK